MLGRVIALLLKEPAGLWKDRKTRFVILIPPLLQVIVFAHAATYDVSDVALGVWNEDADAPKGRSWYVVSRVSEAFRIAADIRGPAQAAAAIDSKRVAAVLHLPQTFSADVLAGRPCRNCCWTRVGRTQRR